jgi:hypothetical protein
VILKVCPQMVLEGEGACDTAARLIQTHWECWE